MTVVTVDGPTWAALPFAASLLVLGMPHGAADGALAWRWASGHRRPWARVGAIMGLYTVVIGVTCLLLAVAPRAALTAFLGLAAAHFGDRAAVLWRSGSAPASWAIGAAIVFGAFLPRPTETTAVFSGLSERLGGHAFGPAWTVAMAAIGALAFASLVVMAVRSAWRPRGWQVVVVMGVIATHATLPPLASVGLWFLAWHALPETVAIGRAQAPAAGPIAQVMIVHAGAVPLLLPVLLVVAWLVGTAGGRGGGGPLVVDIAAWALIAYAAVTPGHVAFQAWHAARLRDAGAAAHAVATPMRPDRGTARRVASFRRSPRSGRPGGAAAKAIGP